jgi:hypothetical protein
MRLNLVLGDENPKAQKKRKEKKRKEKVAAETPYLPKPPNYQVRQMGKRISSPTPLASVILLLSEII